ncbi:MAG: long-chain-acyl-CoA synthetase [Candidatus Lokiarchaeota archaeon]|nr:long-chain-acyl-CoA synthetase [Candidatus Lokiarchaeota archaeon]
MINTIPHKIPGLIREHLEKGNYDKIILFSLAVYGSHKLKEFVNNPGESIDNRMDKALFFQWADKLKKNQFIEEYELDDEISYRISSKGEDEVLSYPEVLNIIKMFEEIFGPIEKGKNLSSKSVSGYRITYKDYIFGLLTLLWRLDSFLLKGEFDKIGPDKKVSLGKCLERNAVKFPNNKALLFEDQEYAYKELNEWINRYSNFFLSLGVERGEIINVFLENRPELMFIMAAMSKIGTIGSLINTRQRSATLRHSLKLNPVRIYLIGEELLDAFEEVKGDLDLTQEDKLYFIVDKGEMDIPEGYIDFRAQVKNQNIKNPSTTADILGKETYVFIFTSGTTGLPKAAHIRNVHTVGSMLGWGKMALNMQPDDIYYISLPIYHSNALHIGWASAIVNGSAVALARRFSVRTFWKDITKFKATCFNYIGEICRYLYNQPPNPNDRKHTVYKIAGNGLRPEIWKEFKERFGIREVYEHYGMTEMQGMFCNYLNRDCTIGICLSDYTIVKYDIENDEPIRGEDGFLQVVDEGEAGLFLMKIQDPYTFAGYTSKSANQQKILENAFEEGDIWLYSGDLIRNIGHNHAQFVDRLGDTFRWKGENVSTSEVEDVISSFEEVEHSSVYGILIPNTEGRAGMASIISNKNHKEFNFDGLKKVVNENLPKYAIPLFIRFLDELSTTDTYKIPKSDMKKVGFDIGKTEDSIYVLLPDSTDYTLLTEEIYSDVMNEKYRF